MANNIGEKIKSLRKRKHLTQSDLAELLGYKDKSMIAHIENGDSDMPYDKMLLFIKKLNIDANLLFFEETVVAKEQTVPSKIGPFKRYVSRDTSMEFGYYYTLVMTLPFAAENKRTVRVWLPEDYDFENPNKKYPVIYMSDGHNLVDKKFSAFGDTWEFDKAVQQNMREGYPGVIAVGIDCPKDPLERTRELCPPFVPKPEIVLEAGPELAHSYGDKFIRFIIYNLKPLIDKTFHTLPDRKNTGIGGSSMGGLMSFFAAMIHPEAIGFTLSFSPALFFYDSKDWLNIMKSYDVKPTEEGKAFLYCGGTGFEAKFLPDVLNSYFYFAGIDYKSDRVRLVVDTDEEHTERAWAKYLPMALRFWFDEKKPKKEEK
ncbi:MAG: helix-turn-helix domain-containing protein, partial [Bacilli bacterium]|nr:helix-turn-helix domain-containing protein [Bacilli bacterium]